MSESKLVTIKIPETAQQELLRLMNQQKAIENQIKVYMTGVAYALGITKDFTLKVKTMEIEYEKD